MPRKTDSSNPADWIAIAASDLEGVQHLVGKQIAFSMCLSKLAEVLEKIIKAELLRQGWFLLKIHDLVKLSDELRERDPDLADRIQPLTEVLADKYFTDRYPGFDLEDEDWPALNTRVGEVAHLLAVVKDRLAAAKPPDPLSAEPGR